MSIYRKKNYQYRLSQHELENGNGCNKIVETLTIDWLNVYLIESPNFV